MENPECKGGSGGGRQQHQSRYGHQGNPHKKWENRPPGRTDGGAHDPRHKTSKTARNSRTGAAGRS